MQLRIFTTLFTFLPIALAADTDYLMNPHLTDFRYISVDKERGGFYTNPTLPACGQQCARLMFQADYGRDRHKGRGGICSWQPVHTAISPNDMFGCVCNSKEHMQTAHDCLFIVCDADQKPAELWERGFVQQCERMKYTVPEFPEVLLLTEVSGTSGSGALTGWGGVGAGIALALFSGLVM